MLIYLVVMYGLGMLARRRIHDVEDFLVAGRKLPLSFAWMTLLATWFGAGTLLTAADEVREGGLQRAALDPFGAGTCLLLAGLFVAGPMWRMHLLTVPDFFRQKFGATAETISSLILVPSYFGWIAAQFTALAGVMQLFFGMPNEWGLLLVAIVGTGYTLLGGMWSVTLTDVVQVSLMLIGLVILACVVLADLGSGNVAQGLQRIASETDPEMLVVVPTHDLQALVGWLGIFVIGAAGNLPAQDLMQRVFASKSEHTARLACLVAGIMYLLFGAIPLLLALAGNLLYPNQPDIKILPMLAQAFLNPWVAVLFIVALLSAILSTIDSAVLSPASVLAQNLFPKFGQQDTLRSNRIAVLLVACCSLILAYLGEDAYALLEASYSCTLVGLFVPMMIGLYSQPSQGRAANTSMLGGIAIWFLHYAQGWEHFLQPWIPETWLPLPVSIAATLCGLVIYFVQDPPWKIHWSRSHTASSPSQH